MRKKMLNAILVAFVGLTAAATTCYYNAWPACPASPTPQIADCPDGSGNVVYNCESEGDSEQAATTSGAPNDSKYCGTKLWGSSCRYQCYWGGWDRYSCGELTQWHTNSIPDTSTGICPDHCY
jgi:hypothetical protein